MNDHGVTPLHILRMMIFYPVSLLATSWFGITSIIFFSWLPYRVRAPYLLLWNRFSLWWGRVACGVNYRIIGIENIPTTPVVILSKHESQWETVFLSLHLKPISTVLKKELLSIPGFGWGLRLMCPIGIDRSTPREALRQIIREGKSRLSQGFSVLVFPEGTRTLPGETGSFARGGASLATKARVPVLPIAHNAGVYWPAKKLMRYPGTITVVIGPPMDTSGRKATEITDAAEQWVRLEVEKLAKLENNKRGQ